MDEEPTHILTKMGVLASFSISKKLTEREVIAIARSVNKNKNSDEIVAIIREKIMNEIVDASRDGTLPGILVENEKLPVPVKQIEELNKIVETLSKKIKNKNLDTLSLCYFINYLVGSLGLTEEDFEEFHRRLDESQDNNEEL